MALNQAQLMATPGGTGAIANYPGAIKQGTGITISNDGTTTLNTATETSLGGVIVGDGLNITGAGVLSVGSVGVASVTGGTGIQVTGTTNVVVGLRPATSGTIGGVKVAASSSSGLVLAGDGSLSVAGTGQYLPLTGGTISSNGFSDPNFGNGSLLIQSPQSTPSVAPLAVLKGPGTFPPDSGIYSSFLFAVFDPEDDLGLSIRMFDADGVVGQFDDTSISNQLLGAGTDNLWFYSTRQWRLNASNVGGAPAGVCYLNGPPGLGGRAIANMSNSGSWSVLAPQASQLYQPATPYVGGLSQLANLTASVYVIAEPISGSPGSQTVGFTKEELEANFPLALKEVETGSRDDSGFPEYFCDYQVITTTLVTCVQELSEQLDTLRTEFDNYVATHP